MFVLGNVECISGRRVHPVSFGSLGCVLGVVGFIRVRWVISGSTWVHPGSLSSLELALEVVKYEHNDPKECANETTEHNEHKSARMSPTRAHASEPNVPGLTPGRVSANPTPPYEPHDPHDARK